MMAFGYLGTTLDVNFATSGGSEAATVYSFKGLVCCLFAGCQVIKVCLGS